MIEHVIDRFIGNGINNFIFSVNYKKEIIKPFIKEISKIKEFKYSLIEEKKRLGTAGSLKLLKNIKENFFLTNCDTIIKGSLKKIYDYHKSNNNIITLVASKKEVIIPYGIYKINNKKTFSKIVEKPRFNYLVNTGFYVLSPKILKIIPTQKRDEIIAKLREEEKSNIENETGDPDDHIKIIKRREIFGKLGNISTKEASEFYTKKKIGRAHV